MTQEQAIKRGSIRNYLDMARSLDRDAADLRRQERWEEAHEAAEAHQLAIRAAWAEWNDPETVVGPECSCGTCRQAVGRRP